MSAQSGAEAGRHLQLALKFPEEGEALIEKDPLQASEKLYRAGEAVKALAAALDLERARVAAGEGGWRARPLNRAAAEKLAPRWKAAYCLHVEGFREARLDSEDVRRNPRHVEANVRAAERLKPPNAPGNRRAGAA